MFMTDASKRPARLKKFWALKGKQKLLLIKVLFVLSVYKGLLVVLPFRYVVKPGSGSHPASPAVSEDRLKAVIWAIAVVSKPVFLGFTCLVQALAAKWLLKNNYTTRLGFGVHKQAAAGFSAHAWLMHEGKVILGEQATPVFTPILEWQ